MKKSVAQRLEGLSEDEIVKYRESVEVAKAYYLRLKKERQALPPEATAFDIEVVNRLVAEAKQRWRDLRTMKPRPLESRM